MSCNDFILSEDTLDLIVVRDETENAPVNPVCIQPISEGYSVWYYDKNTLPPLSIESYSYSSIPNIYWLMDSTSLEVSGIIALQNQPTLALKGKGVLIGIVDTGIDYTNPLFKNPEGTTRILSMWDQTVNTASVNTENENFLYGEIYNQDQINRALLEANPRELIPMRDEIGHGTFLASVAAGSPDPFQDFIGAAPESELVIVKLKQAKEIYRDFYFLPKEEPLYQENDIMAGIAYLEAVASQAGRPLVILLGLGSNQGSHTGTGPLSIYMNTIGTYRGRSIVIPAGNEAITQHHFYGETNSLLKPVEVEINVEAGIEGFCMELWAFAPELVRVMVQSPTGQQSQSFFPIFEGNQTTNFVFENTILNISYRFAGRESGDLVVFFRFLQPAEGLWTVYVYPENAITGAFHMWLPIQPKVGGDVTFLRPNPDVTLTTPSAARIPISVGGYDALTGARYLQSGRGFDAMGRIKPDFCAPSVNVFGAGLRENFVTMTGNSAAAAITAGAAALVLEWGVLRGNVPTMNSIEIKNLLVRGCQREENINYPNKEWGYGKLDVYNTFQVLRE